MWTRLVQVVAVLVLFLGWPGVLQAETYKDWTGYNRLVAELGSGLPTGAGVPVAMVEADANGDAAGQPYGPDNTNSEFAGKNISYTLGEPPNDPYPYSSHATGVGKLFFGTASSFSPGVTSITSDLADRWLEQDIYRNGDPDQPWATAHRVANHSWVGIADVDNDNILRRLDWLIARDDYIQVVGMNNGATNYPLLGSSFNAISVGRSDGNHAQGSVQIDSVYSSGRTRPDLVAPLGTSSTATPLVASSAALLVGVGHDGGSDLSHDPVESFTTNRVGDTIYNAERAEVLKATLMAGADRTSPRLTNDITPSGYSVDTANGLNSRYGAGELNIYSSYHILAAGEQNSAEDAPGSGGLIGPVGFDYDPQFGGGSGSNREGSYYFNTDLSQGTLTASLVWHVCIDGGTPHNFDGTATLYDLDLFLYDITDPDDWLEKAFSSSEGDNTENLWVDLVANRDYVLQVVADTPEDFLWDYGMAWMITANPVPVPGSLWLLATGLGALMGTGLGRRRRQG